jgi:hypothetical protein
MRWALKQYFGAERARLEPASAEAFGDLSGAEGVWEGYLLHCERSRNGEALILGMEPRYHPRRTSSP